MARKKKKEEPAVSDAAVGYTQGAAPAPAAALAPPSDNGHSKETPEFMAGIREKAIEQARESGLRPPFDLSGPDRVNYPKHGHGYVVTIKEQTGKCRLGSARFTSEGVHSYWSLDTLITG